MRLTRTVTVIAILLSIAVFAPGKSAQALVVNAQLDHVNNGNVITLPSQIIDVSANDSAGPAWRVTVGGGLNFEQFFFNYDHTLQATDVTLSGSSIGQWSAVPTGGTAGNFGQFSFKWDGPVSGGLSELTFDILAAGNFIPNAKEAVFAAKIASEQGGNAGGFVSNAAVSAVPLPAAAWLFVTAILSLLGYSSIRRRTALV
jgi:hypothetical protein